MLTSLLAALMIAAAPPLELDVLLDEVSRSAPAVGVQRESVAVARAAVGVAGTWESPTVSVMAESIPLPGAGGGEEPVMITYRFSQELNLFGRRRLARRAAGAQVGAEQARLRRIDWDARAQAVALFYELWMTGEMARLIDIQIAALEDMREAALSRYRAGMAMGHHDVLRAEAEIKAMEAERASLADEQAAIAAMINTLRGRPPGEALGEPVLPAQRPLPDVGQLLARAGGRPEIGAAQAMRLEMGARRELAGRMYWPMVMVEGQYEQRLDGMPDGLGAALVVSVPLWWWERPAREVAMADAMVRRADREVAAMRAMTEAELRMAWSRARAAERRVRALEDAAIPSMAETVSSIRDAYMAGTGEFLSLLDAILALQELRAERLRALARLGVARFELARVIAAPLNEVNP